MNVAVIRGKCSSCAACVLLAPEVFDLDDDDALVILLDASPPESLYDGVRQAARDCPTEAILLTES